MIKIKDSNLVERPSCAKTVTKSVVKLDGEKLIENPVICIIIKIKFNENLWKTIYRKNLIIKLIVLSFLFHYCLLVNNIHAM